MEIVLLVAGGIIFVVSFILPAGREKESAKENKALVKEEIKGFVSQEIGSVKSHVDDVVEESVTDAMERTERSLERISNEKIMAVNQYSDTVLEEIHKNHQEVMFLYDMLNDKHDSLKKTISEADRAAREAEEMQKEEKIQEAAQQEAEFPKTDADAAAAATSAADKKQMPDSTDVSPAIESDGQEGNCNDRILALHRAGKSKVAIAKELGLGVGEVKLVIDLYRKV